MLSTVMRKGYFLDRKLFSFKATSLTMAGRSSSYSTQPVERLPSFTQSESSLSSKLMLAESAYTPAVAFIILIELRIGLKDGVKGVGPLSRLTGRPSEGNTVVNP